VTDGPEVDALDADALRRHLAGDPGAFAEIVRRHRDRLWAVALRTTGDPEEAADALQDALVSAMRHAHTFRAEARLSTWLHRVVVNACLDRLRRKASRPTVPLPDDEHGAAPPAGGRDDYDASDTALDISSAMATLSASQRAAIVLVDIEGYSVEDAASILGVPGGTVKSRCARGRARLVPLLAHLRPASPRPASAAGDEGNPPAGANVEPPMTSPREELR